MRLFPQLRPPGYRGHGDRYGMATWWAHATIEKGTWLKELLLQLIIGCPFPNLENKQILFS